MPNYTPNINLRKPLGTEFYSVNDQNGNMDILDTQIQLLRAKDTSIDAQIATLQADKGIWIGGLERGIPDLNDAPDGVVPFTENSLNRPPGALFGSVATKTGRNPNFRIQEGYDDSTEYGGKYIRKKVLGTWYSWEGPINFNDVVVGKQLIVDAINDKGIPSSTTDSYATLASNIRSITTGGFASGTLLKNITDGIEVTGLSFTPRVVYVADTNNEYMGNLVNNTILRSDNTRSLTINVVGNSFRAFGSILDFTPNTYWEAYA